MGAENLLGHGDMLYLPPGTSMPTRVHGAFVADHEVHTVVRHLKKTASPQYLDEILDGPTSPTPSLVGIDKVQPGADAEQDPLYDQAVQVVMDTRKASISGVQRRLKIGYNRAARMVESMEAAGLVGPLQSNGSREILVATSNED
jgi:S-DNA-T family DNA segregation ATPase FtsK/SpoIIIE